MAPVVISRKDAKAVGQTQYFTGLPCKQGHIAFRWVSGYGCATCQQAYAVSDVRRTYMRDYQRDNPERVIPRNERWKAKNRETVRAKAREWHKTNPGKSRANTVRRRMALNHATPAWADHAKITAIYEEAARLTRETGRPHEVDHIVPVAGRNVCGLHVHTNLRVIERGPNRRKSNKYEQP